MVLEEGIGMEFPGLGNSGRMDLNTLGFGFAASFAACCFLRSPQPHKTKPHKTICVGGFLEGMMTGRWHTVGVIMAVKREKSPLESRSCC